MSARREVRVGDRVRIGKGRRRFTVVAIYRPVSWWLGEALDVDALRSGLEVATIVESGGRHAYASPKSKRRGKGRRVELARLVRA